MNSLVQRPRLGWVLCGAVFLFLSRGLPAQGAEKAPEPPPYASWLPKDKDPRSTGIPFKSFLLLDSRGAAYRDPIRTNRLIDELSRSPFDTVVVQVRAFGDAYYASELVPRALGVSATFDPLDEVIKGLKKGAKPKRIYAWLDLYRVANVNRAIPLSPDHILKRHPEWISRNSKFQTEDSAGNQYLEPGLDAVQQYLEQVIVELLQRYPLDGVVLDGIRYPELTSDWGYHPELLSAWRKESGQTDSPKPDDPSWRQFRRRILEHNVHRFQIQAHTARESAQVLVIASSEGPAPATIEDFDGGNVYNGALQDWPDWMKQKYVDGVILANFRQEGPDTADYDAWNEFAAMEVQQTGVEIYPAIAGFANISIDTLSQLRRVQDIGLAGAALSNYLEPVRDSASRELFFRALAKTVFGPDSTRLTFLPAEGEEKPEEQETAVAGLLPNETGTELELPPPPELGGFDATSPDLVPKLEPLEPEPQEPEKPRESQMASLLEEASARLAPKREGLIEPQFQAIEYLRQKYPNIFGGT